MNNNSRTLVLLGVLLGGIAGLAGFARAELIEPAVPLQEPVKEYRPVPVPVPRPEPQVALPQATAPQATAPQPTLHQATATQPTIRQSTVHQAMVHQALAIRRPSLVRTVAIVVPPRPQPHCGWLECGSQFVIVGMGF